MNKALYRALPAIIIMAGGLAAQAATLNVGAGQTHTTIGAAIAAANAGDTIQIKDSGTYNESLTIGKRITIQADIGQSPVLRGDGVTTHILKTTTGSGGAQIGSNEGGQILLDGQGATTVKGVIVPSHGRHTGRFRESSPPESEQRDQSYRSRIDRRIELPLRARHRRRANAGIEQSRRDGRHIQL